MVRERIETRSNASRRHSGESSTSTFGGWSGFRSRVERALLGAGMNLVLMLVERRLKRRLTRPRGAGNPS